MFLYDINEAAVGTILSLIPSILLPKKEKAPLSGAFSFPYMKQ